MCNPRGAVSPVERLRQEGAPDDLSLIIHVSRPTGLPAGNPLRR